MEPNHLHPHHSCLQVSGENPEEKYCKYCGVKLAPKRLNLKEILKDFLKQFFELDLPLLNTLKEMMVSPGRFCREYIQGTRSRKTNPLQFYIVSISIYFFLYFALDINESIQQKVTDYQQFSPDAPVQLLSVIERFNHIIFSNIKYFSFLIIPSLALILRIFFRKKPFNIAETLVFVLFLQGESSLIGCISCLMFVIHPQFYWNVTFITIVYESWGIISFYGKPSFSGLLKGGIVCVLSNFLYIAVTSLLVILYIWIF